MARMSPAAQLERIKNAAPAWRMHATGHKFWGMTVSQLEAKLKPSIELDATITRLRLELRIALAQRRVSHARSLRLIYQVGLAVKGDADFGPNSQLLEDLGYTRDAVVSRKLRKKRRNRAR